MRLAALILVLVVLIGSFFIGCKKADETPEGALTPETSKAGAQGGTCGKMGSKVPEGKTGKGP